MILLMAKKGNDDLYGKNGNDVMNGSKGLDWLYGGKGSDIFVISKKFGKGKKNEDRIYDFEDGKDKIEVYGSIGKIVIQDSGKDAYISKGNDVLAYVEGAAGLLSWSADPGIIM